MSICLRHVKAIVRNQIFFTNFAFVCSEESDKNASLPSNGFPYSWQTRW